MKRIAAYTEELNSDVYKDRLFDIYLDETRLNYQKERYISALKDFSEIFGDKEVEVYSAPGRSEIGGNHTDHQHGEVLCASINDDAIAVVSPTGDKVVRVLSKGYDMITVDLSDLTKDQSEEGTTKALIKGVLSECVRLGFMVDGFDAFITSDVLSGSGLSSSAAFETIIGTIVSGLFNDMGIDAIKIAMIGQVAENDYFGKPCGLMDQMACSVGSLCHIDFCDPKAPKVERVEFDLHGAGYSLVITDTKGSHADLTDDYAAVPFEMKSVAGFFGKDVLIEVDESEVMKAATDIRKSCGDRAFLRAVHFYEENKRVKKEVAALRAGDIEGFLATVKASGDSSYKYLQNVFTTKKVNEQNVSIALMLSELNLSDNGVCRVHGGGFAGTIQAFVKNEAVDSYKAQMDAIFGEGASNVLQIRKYGGIKVF